MENISFYKKNIDNGEVNCSYCKHFESADQEAGILYSGCIHPILYDDNDNLIEELNSLILVCLDNPKHCVLYEDKRYLCTQCQNYDINTIELKDKDGIFYKHVCSEKCKIAAYKELSVEFLPQHILNKKEFETERKIVEEG